MKTRKRILVMAFMLAMVIFTTACGDKSVEKLTSDILSTSSLDSDESTNPKTV